MIKRHKALGVYHATPGLLVWLSVVSHQRGPIRPAVLWTRPFITCSLSNRRELDLEREGSGELSIHQPCPTTLDRVVNHIAGFRHHIICLTRSAL